MRVNILAIGKNRQGVFRELYDFYVKRIQWDIQLIEFETQKTQNWKKQRLEETKKLVSSVPKGSPVVILDETGKLVSSREFSGWIGEHLDNGARNISNTVENLHLMVCEGQNITFFISINVRL